VSFSRDTNNNKDQLTSETANNHTSTSSSIKHQVCFCDINIFFFIDLISRMSLNQQIPMKNHVSYQLGCQHLLTVLLLNDNVNRYFFVKKILTINLFTVSSEGNDNKNANEPSTTSGKFYFGRVYLFYYLFVDTSTTVVSKSPKLKTFDSDSGDGFDSVVPKKSMCTCSSLILPNV